MNLIEIEVVLNFFYLLLNYLNYINEVSLMKSLVILNFLFGIN